MVDGKTSLTRLPERDGEKGGEGSLAFTLRTPIDLSTFGKDIVEAFDLEEEPGIISAGSARNASEKEPVVIWIMADDLNANTLRGLVNSHELPLNEMEALVKKALAGETLTEDEMQKAVRLLLISRR